MNNNLIFYPLLAQIALVIVIYIILGKRKSAARKAKTVNLKEAAVNNRAWTDDVVKVSNNLANQFEAPVLFFLLCIMIHAMKTVDVFSLVLAWLFVSSRLVHSYIHINKNHVPTRLKWFALGLVAIILLMLKVFYDLMIGG